VNATVQGLAGAADMLDGFQGHHRADHAGQGADHADAGTGFRVRWGLRHPAAIAGGVRAGVEQGNLTVPAPDSAGDERLARGQAGLIHRVARRVIIAPVQHQVGLADQAFGVLLVERLDDRSDLCARIEGTQGAGPGLGLGRADMAGSEDDLALQIVHGHRIGVDQADRANAGGRQVERGGGAQASGADNGDMGPGQRLLAGSADLLENKMAGEAVDIDFGSHAPLVTGLAVCFKGDKRLIIVIDAQKACSRREQGQSGAMSVPANSPLPAPALSEHQERLLDWLSSARPNVFLTGRAGTGKTTLMREFLRRAGPRAAVIAPTGVAAMQAGGQTIHSFFHFPPRMIGARDIRKVRHRRAVQALETLVIDEISMVRADMMWAIDKALRLNRERNEPFGGVQLVLVGDLAQLPPVVQGAEAEYLESTFGGPFFFHPESFRDAGFSYVELEQVFRQTDSYFVDILNAIRDGDLDSDKAADLNDRVTGRSGLEASLSHIVLTATNETAWRINQARLEGLPTSHKAFEAKVEGQFDQRLFPAEEPLVLKIGARVMLTRNDPQGRWVNGTLGQVEGFDEKAVRVRIGDVVHAIEPQKWERNAYAFDPEKQALTKTTAGAFTQYPLRLAWAMTIHKAQGLTLDKVYLDLARRLFAHGQAYVALSRARSLEGLELSRPLTPNDVISDPRIFDVTAFCDPAPASVGA